VVDSNIIYLFYKAIMVCSRLFLELLGFDTTLVFSSTLYKYPVYALQINEGNYVFMGISCLGILIMGGFATLIIAYPGKWKHKLWYIPLGFLVIQILNIFRMSILTILFSYYNINVLKEYNLFGIFTLNHHDFFNILLYIMVFFMFTFYVNHFGAKDLEDTGQKPIKNPG
jgi:exosortase/archaeosortase family protein